MIAFVALARERIGRRDAVIAAVLSLLGVALMYDNVYGGLADDRRTNPDAQAVYHVGNLVPEALAIPLFLLVTVPVLWRRAAPLAAVAAAFGGLVLNEALLGSEFLRCGVVLPIALLFGFTAGAQLQGRDLYRALALAVALTVLDLVVTFGALTAAAMGALVVAVWGSGRVVQSRRRMADELAVRTDALRVARDERSRLEVATDRARLSSKLDEVLQRRLGELARMADAGAALGDPEHATATLIEIERESRRTLDEMRSLVGVLRDDASDAPTAPQPTLTHLEALIARAHGNGARLTVDGNPRTLPAAVELSAFRVVEHLLDALEDAPGVDVRVRFGDDALDLTMSGPAGRHAKASIERAHERVRLHRGTLESSVRGGRAEAVVSLPLHAAV
jgi:hypothetical protein